MLKNGNAVLRPEQPLQVNMVFSWVNRRNIVETLLYGRTISGVCNNLANPSWGASDTKLARVLPASFSDGVGEPRGTQTSRFALNPIGKKFNQ